jgi:hypothetical protein
MRPVGVEPSVRTLEQPPGPVRGVPPGGFSRVFCFSTLTAPLALAVNLYGLPGRKHQRQDTTPCHAAQTVCEVLGKYRVHGGTRPDMRRIAAPRVRWEPLRKWPSGRGEVDATHPWENFV